MCDAPHATTDAYRSARPRWKQPSCQACAADRRPVTLGRWQRPSTFFFDPICPWAWRASQFIRAVAEREQLLVSWRFFSLRMCNEERSYVEFPDGYRARHEFGLALLRVAAHLRSAEGNGAVDAFYRTCGTELHDRGHSAELVASRDVERLIQLTGVSVSEAAAPTADALIRSEIQLAISRAGPDLGTPVITIEPPHGPSFFGPVLSTVPDEQDQAATWHSIIQLAGVPAFSEIKRIRQPPS